MSSTGGGKGRSFVIPKLLTYPGSVLCLDLKGQNAAVTAEPGAPWVRPCMSSIL